MKEIKEFSDLVFKPHMLEINSKQAKMFFENGYGVSVLQGKMFYSNGIDTYEVAVLKEGRLCYDTPITDNVIGYVDKDRVSEIMKQIQEL